VNHTPSNTTGVARLLSRAFGRSVRGVIAVTVFASAFGVASGAASGAAPATANPASMDPPTWQVGVGSRIPTPIAATAVRGRMPGFLEPDVTYVLAFVNFKDPASRQVVPELDRIQTEHGKKVSVVAITDEGPEAARLFVESAEWAPRIGFVVAADPRRAAFRTFFGPQGVPTLPIGFIMRNESVLWVGNPEQFEDHVRSIVRGTWDIEAARRAQEQRALWNRVLDGVERMAQEKRFDDALAALDDACQSALGDQVAQCKAVRFTLLARAGRVDEAVAVGDAILKSPLNPKQPAGLAWAILNSAPDQQAAREFALRAAAMSDTALRGRDPMVATILARAQYLNGRRSEAVETARRALSLADTPDMKEAISIELRRYEESTGAPPVQPSTSAPREKATNAPLQPKQP